MVTVSPDVASSTNLGGWINKSGIWSVGERRDWFADDPQTLVHWHETTGGRHIELGIAETNLVGLLGELGATWSRYGQPLLPIGTIYDPFVGRALEPWSFGIYAGRPVDPDRHAVRGVAGAGGRRAPVDRHAVDRDRPAGLHLLGAGLRPGPRVDAAPRALAARPARRRVGLLPALHPPARPGARRRRQLGRAPRARARRRLPAAAREGQAGGRARRNGRGDAGAAARGRHAGRGRRGDLRDERRPPPARVPGARRLRRAPRGDPRRAVPRGAGGADGHGPRRGSERARVPRRR